MITGLAEAPEPADASRVPEQLRAGGWREAAPYVFVRDSEVEFVSRVAGDDAACRLLPDECRTGDCLFWDTETTGLAGAGTVIFLVGCGWVEGPRVRLQQVFLADFPGEQRFLEHLRDLFSRFQVFVSYNGKAFDSSILKTRLVMSGVTMALGYQLDLLYLARRFWRRLLDNCRLTTIEQEVLGLSRGEDIPGWMAPEIYFDSLRRGVLGQLPAVFEHNESDVVALVRLLEVVNGVLTGGADHEPPVGVDRGAVGSFLLEQGDRRGARMLRQAYRGGDEDAGHRLGMHLKRASDWRSAVSLWHDMAHAHGSLHAAVELSKYYEHRARDLPAALASIAPFLPPRGAGAARGALGELSGLVHREARIRAKLRRAAAT